MFRSIVTVPLRMSQKGKISVYFALVAVFFSIGLLIVGTGLSPEIIQVTVIETVTRPTFIGELSAENRNICVGVNQGAIWERGESADDLWRQILENTEMRIDARLINYNRPVFAWATLSSEFGNSGPTTASRVGVIAFCFDVQNLPTGRYTSSIRVWSRSGVEHAYPWEFDVER